MDAFTAKWPIEAGESAPMLLRSGDIGVFTVGVPSTMLRWGTSKSISAQGLP